MEREKGKHKHQVKPERIVKQKQMERIYSSLRKGGKPKKKKEKKNQPRLSVYVNLTFFEVKQTNLSRVYFQQRRSKDERRAREGKYQFFQLVRINASFVFWVKIERQTWSVNSNYYLHQKLLRSWIYKFGLKRNTHTKVRRRQKKKPSESASYLGNSREEKHYVQLLCKFR